MTLRPTRPRTRAQAAARWLWTRQGLKSLTAPHAPHTTHPAPSRAGDHVNSPPLVRLTGALHPLEEKGHGGLLTLTVSIKSTRWLFRIAKVENLTGRDPSSLRLLQSLFPPQMRLTGPEELLAPLQEQKTTGKPLTIEGHFYTQERMLFVTAVIEAKDKLKQAKPAGIL